MKVRNGFISNSSSSSFVIVECDDEKILKSSEYCCHEECWEEYSMLNIGIDDLIEKLTELKSKGKRNIYIYGGTYSDNC